SHHPFTALQMTNPRSSATLFPYTTLFRSLIVAEYYPRTSDPVLGIWAHRQAVASRDEGAEIRVLVLYRPLPPLSAARAGDVRARSEEHTSELQSPDHLVCRLLLEKKK